MNSREIISEYRKGDAGDVDIQFRILLLLDDLSLQYVMREMEAIELCRALIGCGEEFLSRITANMGSRGGALLREDIEYLTPDTPAEDVRKARLSVLNAVRQLEKSGQILV